MDYESVAVDRAAVVSIRGGVEADRMIKARDGADRRALDHGIIPCRGDTPGTFAAWKAPPATVSRTFQATT